MTRAPLSVEFSCQEHWSGLPFPSPGDLHNPGIKPGSPALQADSLLSEPPGNQRLLAVQTEGRLGGFSHPSTGPLRFLKENHFLLAGNGVKTMKFNVKEASPSGRSRNNRLSLLNSLGCSELLPSSAFYGPESHLFSAEQRLQMSLTKPGRAAGLRRKVKRSSLPCF